VLYSARHAPRRADHEQTWLASRPDAPSSELPPTRRVSSDYRVGVYVYEYESGAPDGEGAFVPYDGALSTRSQREAPALSALLGAQRSPRAPALQ
jgi:hypothetical protein